MVFGGYCEADWFIDSSESTEGVSSIRSGLISHDENSAIVFSGLFSGGTLSFDSKVDSESCCDFLDVYVDGDRVARIASGGWIRQSISLVPGEHSIELRYDKSGSVSTGRDAAWIDNVRFE